MGTNFLCVIPARSGSKGLKNKNIKKINKISLIGHAVSCAIKTKIFDEIIISTDSKLYGLEAKKYGAAFFYLRSKNLSKSRVGDIDVIYDALKRSEKNFKKKYHYIAMLQPTCPTRKSLDIIKCKKEIIKRKLDSVWTVSKIDKKFHPLKILKVNKDKSFENYIDAGKKIIARQQLSDVFIRNGACYFFSRQSIIKKNLYGKKNGLILIRREMINIDDINDLNKARKVLN